MQPVRGHAESFGNGKEESRMDRIKKDGGMMTVEAAAVVPVLSLIVVGVTLLFLFFLDLSAAKSEAIRAAGEAASAWKTGGDLATGDYRIEDRLEEYTLFLTGSLEKELAQRAQERMIRRINERLVVGRLQHGDVRFAMGTVRAEAELILRWPLAGVEEYMGEHISFRCLAAAPVDNWQEVLRMGESLTWK